MFAITKVDLDDLQKGVRTLWKRCQKQRQTGGTCGAARVGERGLQVEVALVGAHVRGKLQDALRCKQPRAQPAARTSTVRRQARKLTTVGRFEA